MNGKNFTKFVLVVTLLYMAWTFVYGLMEVLG